MSAPRFNTCAQCGDRRDSSRPRVTGVAVGGQINPSGDPS